ncbi:MAG: VWA domain-containing protein [Acidobacteria bacterium]|nr:VWA domain-containing protein [Acidobacteriota bacterium]
MRPRFPILPIVAAVLSLFAVAGVRAEDPPPNGYVETVDVSLVVLHVTVLDSKGEPVQGLSPRDFHVREDDVFRKISVFGSSADQAVRVAFLLDVSGSMEILGKLSRAKEAIRLFAASLLPHDEIALLIFADGQVVVKLGFTSDREALSRTLDGIDAYGRTALHDALAEAPFLLSATEAGRKALIILTDGVDNASTISNAEAIEMARRAPVPIFAIGLADQPLDLRPDPRGEGKDRPLFETLAEFTSGTGGEMVTVFSPKEIQAAVDLLDRRLRGQYVVGYAPGPSGDVPGFHRIDVTTRDKRHRVMTRKGYTTSP